MKLNDLFRLSAKALLDRKVRSALTILGIIVGTAMILALIASTNGLSASVQTQIEKIGVSTLTIRSGFGPQSSAYRLSRDDLPVLQSIPGVKEVVPFYSRSGTIDQGGSTLQVSIIGVDQVQLGRVYNGLALRSGTMTDAYDVSSAVLGYAVAFPQGNSESQQIADVNQMVNVQIAVATARTRARTLAFLVKGVLSPYGIVQFSNIDETIFISLASAELLFNTPYYSGMYLLLDSADRVDSVTQAIQNNYGSNIRVLSASTLLNNVQAITGQLSLFLGSVGAISLFVAGVGIANTMYVSVMERTREIGILKAIGYTPAEIQGMFLAEASVTGVIGGVIGTAVGYFLSFLMGGSLPLARGFRFISGNAAFNPSFTPELIVFSLTFPILIAVMAGMYPAWRASRLNAVVALKYE